MQRLIITSVVVGLISGLLVGGFHNLFTVPVIERAITLEEERAAAEPVTATGAEEGGTPVSLGVQRIGMTIGTGIYGAILGLVFAAGYTLLRRAVPNWQPLALAAVVGALGFWAISLFPFIKYPLVPPGVGDEGTLLLRQLFQTLFFILSAAGIAGVLLAVRRVNSTTTEGATRIRLYSLISLVYAVFALIIVFAFPNNPDPIPVPIDLLELFRVLTMIGQFILWTLLSAGVALALIRYDKADAVSAGDQLSAVGSQGSRT